VTTKTVTLSDKDFINVLRDFADHKGQVVFARAEYRQDLDKGGAKIFKSGSDATSQGGILMPTKMFLLVEL
jgi:hypothetical protein